MTTRQTIYFPSHKVTEAGGMQKATNAGEKPSADPPPANEEMDREFNLTHAKTTAPTFHNFLFFHLFLELLLLGVDMTLYHEESGGKTTHSYLFHVLFNIPLALLFNFISSESYRTSIFIPHANLLITVHSALYIIIHSIYLSLRFWLFPLYTYIYYAVPVYSLMFLSDWRYSAVLGLISSISFALVTFLQHVPTGSVGAVLVVSASLSYLGYLAETAKRNEFKMILKAKSEIANAKSETQIEDLQKQIAQLTEERDKIDEKCRAKTLFLANACHELRTPLNGVIGMTGVLKKTSLTEEQQEYVDTVYNSGETLLDLVNDILDFSKIEVGKVELEDIPFDVRDVLEEVSEMINLKAHGKGLELITVVPKDLQTRLVGDSTRLRQVVLNLVSNGVKFTDSGHVCISVSLVSSTDTHVILKFEVSDTGIGISQELSKQLFNVWTQANQSTFRKYGGSGLGLAISKQLVNMFEGDITLESEEGKGSTFIFTAKFLKDLKTDDVLDYVKIDKLVEQAKGLNTLVIASHKLHLKALENLLFSVACNVTTTSSCRDALAILKKLRETQPYTVVFIDSERLQKEADAVRRLFNKFPHNYFVLLTKMTERGASRLGCFNFNTLRKPPKRGALLNILKIAKKSFENEAKAKESEEKELGKSPRKKKGSKVHFANDLLLKRSKSEKGGDTEDGDDKREERDYSSSLRADKPRKEATEQKQVKKSSLKKEKETSKQAAENEKTGGETNEKEKKAIPKRISYEELMNTCVDEVQLQENTEEPIRPNPECPIPLVRRSSSITRRFSIGARILLVEDNITNQKVAVRTLGRLGYRCDIAENGIQAIQAIRFNPYELILMDVRMPKMDGLTATREIRKVEAAGESALGRPCVIVAMTANAVGGFKEEALAAGMQDYVTKPVRFEMLQQVLSKYLKDVAPLDATTTTQPPTTTTNPGTPNTTEHT